MLSHMAECLTVCCGIRKLCGASRLVWVIFYNILTFSACCNYRTCVYVCVCVCVCVCARAIKLQMSSELG